jgi:hypothetical protein
MTKKMITVPVAVHTNLFRWQLDLFWFNHKLTYPDAAERADAIIIKRNFTTEPKHDVLEWPTDIPHHMCESVLDCLPPEHNIAKYGMLALPLNIQLGLLQVLNNYDDDQILEVNDCDVFHFRKHPEIEIGDDELFVSDIYEDWHLKSLTTYKNVIEPYFKNNGEYYNGGFIPIIGNVRTFKKIIYDWIAIHIDILNKNWPDNIKWWAGMYALQAACEQQKVTMVAKDYCYVPNINRLSDEQYIAHYCCDNRFNKKTFPDVNIEYFEKNEFYDRVKLWLPEYEKKFGTEDVKPKPVPKAYDGGFYNSKTLNELGLKNDCDKNSYHHNYLECYEFFMQKYRDDKFTLMEIGTYAGASLRTWRDYFRNADIVGIDINENSRSATGPRISVEIVDASKPENLITLQNKYQPLIILDDASHRWSHQQIMFETLFPNLPYGGIYICEDIHTSFETLASEGYGDGALDSFTYFTQLAYLVAGQGKEPGNKTIKFTPFQQNIFKTISSITIRKHTVIITK